MYFIICHYTPLKERNDFIRKQLNDKVKDVNFYNLDADPSNDNVPISDYSFESNINTANTALFVRKFDRDYLNKDILNKYYLTQHDKSNNIRLEFVEHNNYNTNKLTYDNFNSKYNYSLNSRGNKLSEMSLALKHYESLKTISKLDVSYAMIIEDDCVFVDNFMQKLKEKMKLFPAGWDIYYPNSCPNPGFRTKGGFKNLNNTNKIAIKNHPSSVFGVSYLITKNAATKIIDEIEKNKLWLPIDHEFNWLAYKLDLKVIWNTQSPRITLWGQSGFKSSLN